MRNWKWFSFHQKKFRNYFNSHFQQSNNLSNWNFCIKRHWQTCIIVIVKYNITFYFSSDFFVKKLCKKAWACLKRIKQLFNFGPWPVSLFRATTNCVFTGHSLDKYNLKFPIAPTFMQKCRFFSNAMKTRNLYIFFLGTLNFIART